MAANFKATCLALPDKVEKTGKPIRATKRGKPVAQLVPVTPPGKRQIMGSMEGTAKIVGDIQSPVTELADWDVLTNSGS
ncbi:MAG: type II toxin-antitoxin system prevent-host-death family antitoxin [Acidobacteriota bacterium]|nr:type II toxin-antitoxin system prevent-host-death family antitoxin [Acidobacteriota bacterium]